MHRGVGLDDVRRLIRQGKMTVPAALTCMLAMERLGELGLIEGEAKLVVGEDGESPGGGGGGEEDEGTDGDSRKGEEEEGGDFIFPDEYGSGKRYA